MRKITSIILFLGALAVSMAAHPLGNFSINQYSRLDVGRSEIKVRQVLDMAEIPTFQEAGAMDADSDGAISQTELDLFAEKLTPGYLSNLSLTVDGLAITLRATKRSATLTPGAADLTTLRIVWDLAADIAVSDGESKILFRNDNFAERIGWREIVVGTSDGAAVFNSTAFGSSLSDELRTYPEQDRSLPLDERVAEFSFTPGYLPESARPLQNRNGQIATKLTRDRFAELINVREITPAIALFGLLFAFGLGMFHAMSPGHGKTVVGAYLVGSKGTAKHAAFLGLTVTITHTLGVFALGVLTLFASSYVLPETILPFLSFFSGLIVLYIGLTMFKTRLFAALGRSGPHDHYHDAHGHSHDHEVDGPAHTHDGHTHTHLPPDEISFKSLLALGISGGLLPCPSALVLMLSAINLNRVGYGLILTVAFSLGLAATLTAVGLLFVYGGRVFKGSRLGESWIVRALPVMSAFVIACLGAVICYQSLA
ncbi:MAG: high-affinity nickel-transporter [Acidobacteriota bacterium]